MAFPSVASTATSQEGTATTTHDVIVPAGIEAGDLLLLFLTVYQLPTISDLPAGWIQLYSVDTPSSYNRGQAYYKIADGTEVDFTFTTSTSKKSVNRCFRVIDWHGVTPPECGIAATGSSTNPDPPSLSPSWGADDTLWFAVCHFLGFYSLSGYPADFPDNRYADRMVSTGGAGVGTCTEELNAVSEDPETFTLETSHKWGTNTIAVRPAAPLAGVKASPAAQAILAGII